MQQKAVDTVLKQAELIAIYLTFRPSWDLIVAGHQEATITVIVFHLLIAFAKKESLAA